MSSTSQPTIEPTISCSKPLTVCSVNDCGRSDLVGRGYCQRHYQYWWRHGYPEIPNPIIEPLPLTESEAMWLAAVIDCEGWIGVFQNTKSNCISYWGAIGVGNTNIKLINRLLELTGVGRVNGNQPKCKNAKYKYTWMVARHEDVKRVLLSVLPYLILKPEQAKLVISMPAKNVKANSERASIKRQLSVLNRKGVHVYD